MGNAATNVVYPFTVVALALALLIGDGSAALLSLSLGSGDHKTSHKCIGNGIVLSVVVGVILMIIGLLFTAPLLRLFGVTEASYGYAWEYMRVILIGIPFYIFSSGMNGAIRADGSPVYSMITTVCIIGMSTIIALEHFIFCLIVIAETLLRLSQSPIKS